MSTTPRTMHFGAFFQGVSNSASWRDPSYLDPIAFDTFREFANRLETAGIDFLFLAEGLRVREYGGRFLEVGVAGRPDSLPLLTAISAVTRNLGIAATLNTTFNQPFELARQLATVDHFSGGRAAWNVVTTCDGWHGENFRRGGYLPHAQRYERAAEFLELSHRLWRAEPGQTVRFHGTHVSAESAFPAPRSPQGAPVLLQAGESPQGRDFAAQWIDVIFSPHYEPVAAAEFAQDMTARLAARGRARESLLILPAAGAVVADTEEAAAEQELRARRASISPQVALFLASQIWGVDLSGRDPDDPLPDMEPVLDGPVEFLTSFMLRARAATAAKWRRIAAEGSRSLHEVAIEAQPRPPFVGTPRGVADAMTRQFLAGDCDGYILAPDSLPYGLDSVLEKLLPELADRGVFDPEYRGSTLRENLGLDATGSSVHPTERMATS